MIRWTIAERFGWTLDEVDSLSMGDLEEWFQIQDAFARANSPEIESAPEAARNINIRRRRR